ncbi:MAG: T9SS type A sorting domain-containing protein [Bacteroidota bacterium]|nr:T9SS type A sorting domain-containing protein [Bacteroidota bacterium]
MRKLITSLICLFIVLSVGAQTPLSGVYSIGVGGDMETLTEAVGSLTTNGAAGSVTFELSVSYTSTGESFPLEIPDYPGNSSTNRLTIRPADGVTTEISGTPVGTNEPLISIEADFVILNGSYNTEENRNLTLRNTHEGSGNKVIIATGNSLNILNCIFHGNNAYLNNIGIYLSQSNGTIIHNNHLFGFYYGMVLDQAENPNISENEVGSETEADYTQYAGIYLYHSTEAMIHDNHVFNIKNQTGYPAMGIGVCDAIGTNYIYNNRIEDIISELPATTAYGLYFFESTDAEFIAINNIIDHVASGGGDELLEYPSGIVLNNLSGTSLVKLYNNTVNMPPDEINGLSGISRSYGLFTNSENILMKNNIFNNRLGKRDGVTDHTVAYGLFAFTNNQPFTQNDHNLYFVDADVSDNVFAYADSRHMTFEEFQTFTSSGEHSIYSEPMLEACYPQSCSPAVLNAEYLSDVSTDINGVYRDTEHPTIGAYEYEIVQASNVLIDLPVKEWGALRWDNGTACSYIAFMKEGDVLPETPEPGNGITYTANTEFGQGEQIGSSGWFCVYKGTENECVELTGPEGEYTVMVCGYFGEEGDEYYITETANQNPVVGMLAADVENVSRAVFVEPNPISAGNTVMVKTSEQITSIEFISLSGKSVSKIDINPSNNIFVNVPKVSGVYILKINTVGRKYYKKIIVN